MSRQDPQGKQSFLHIKRLHICIQVSLRHVHRSVLWRWANCSHSRPFFTWPPAQEMFQTLRYNSMLSEVVNKKATGASFPNAPKGIPVFKVDSSVSINDMEQDGYHPTRNGYARIAYDFAQAIWLRSRTVGIPNPVPVPNNPAGGLSNPPS